MPAMRLNSVVGISYFLYYVIITNTGGIGVAEGPKEIWATFKKDIKDGNAKVKADHKERTSKIEKPRMDNSQSSGTKKLVALWVALLTAPLFLFGLFLFFVAGVVIWTMF